MVNYIQFFIVAENKRASNLTNTFDHLKLNALSLCGFYEVSDTFFPMVLAMSQVGGAIFDSLHNISSI